MEKKKLLLVAVSVGIFLIIVIGLSILIFLPKNQEQPAGSQVIVRSNSGGEITPAPPPERVEPASIDVMDMLRNREETQGLRALPYQPPAPPPSSPAPRPAGARAPAAETQAGTGANSLVIEVPRPAGAAAVPGASRAPETSRAQPIPPSVSPSPTVTPPTARLSPGADLPQSTAAPTAYKPPAPANPAAIRSPAQPTVPAREMYWVQAGSFSTQVRAEDVKEILSAKGITAIIENRDVNGKNVFRVRVGPYTSQSEADYWLALIKTIKGFEGSQIWQSKS